MDFQLTAEQRHLQAVAEGFLADRFPTDRIVALADSSGLERYGWQALDELGWFDPALGMVGRALVAEACGYALCPLPWPVALALSDPVSTAWARHGFTSRRLAQGGWTVSGRAHVVDAAAAESILVETGDGLFRVGARVAGCMVRPAAGVDPLRRPATVECADAPARPLAAPAAAELVLRHDTVLAAEALGVARRAYDMAVSHAKVREQFGRPIGAYQAVAFPIADSYVRIELARSLLLRAAWQLEAGEAAVLAVAAAVPVTRHAAVANCEQAIQALGGLGMTWEHPLHLWYRRALWFETHQGGDRPHLDTIADALLGSAA